MKKLVSSLFLFSVVVLYSCGQEYPGRVSSLPSDNSVPSYSYTESADSGATPEEITDLDSGSDLDDDLDAGQDVLDGGTETTDAGRICDHKKHPKDPECHNKHPPKKCLER